jgi:hypothetical protein
MDIRAGYFALDIARKLQGDSFSNLDMCETVKETLWYVVCAYV